MKMKAVFTDRNNPPVAVREADIPIPGTGEVLIKISAAPVNPSDLAAIRNFIADTEAPSFIPGLEGSGVVVEAGKGLLPKLWLGRRVTCSPKHGSGGTWAEYMVTDAASCFPLSREISDEQGSMYLVNPLTAIAFIGMAKKGRHKALINNAAASALGRMVELLALKHGIRVINIVRSGGKADYLRQAGSAFVLDSSSPEFASELKKLAAELEATLLFDSVGGEQFRDLVGAMPYGSIIVTYGVLSPQDHVTIDPRKLLRNDLRITGFYLGNQVRKNGLAVNLLNMIKVRNLLRSGMKTKIRATYPLERAADAVNDYISDMSAGKVLLKP